MRAIDLLMLAAVVLPGCGEEGPLLLEVDGGWDPERAAEEMRSALESGDIDLVFAHGDEMARGASEAAREMGREGILFIGVGGMPEQGQKYVRDGVLHASIEIPTGAAEGVDLALLAIAEVSLPREMLLGSKLWTRENVERGGEALPHVGGFLMGILRQEHPEVFSEGEAVTIGVLQCIEDPVRARRTTSEIRETASRYPRLDLEIREAGEDLEWSLRELIAQGHGAIVVCLGRRELPAEAALWALTVGVPVIVLGENPATDQYTCLVKVDGIEVGRAAARWAVQRLGGRDRVLEITGPLSSTEAQDRRAGFAEVIAGGR